MKSNPEEYDRKFLIRAVELAEEGITNGGGPFGAVVAYKGKIISEAYNMVVSSADPTAHAEVLAIRKACLARASHDLSGCILYSSCEPCPMCLGSIYWAGIKKVFFASDRKAAAVAGFGDDFIYDEILKAPGKRTISFNRIDDIDGNKVFENWERFENKKTY